MCVFVRKSEHPDLLLDRPELYSVCFACGIALHHILLIGAAQMGILREIGKISVEFNVENSPNVRIFADRKVEGRYDLKILTETANVGFFMQEFGILGIQDPAAAGEHHGVSRKFVGKELRCLTVGVVAGFLGEGEWGAGNVNRQRAVSFFQCVTVLAYEMLLAEF